ncbi:MAG: hypothetical protein M1835_003454 [Candelina submexicana]|nr:MAG: hypothetical protein M1835_003454 [Candelina submexicana]
MAPPPQQVRIKRKKDEEPVDSLYVQTEQSHKRRRFTDFIFRRVRDEQSVSGEGNGGQLPLPSSTNGKRKILRAVSTQPRTKVPTIQTTLPGDELRDGVNGFGRKKASRNQEGGSAKTNTTIAELKDFNGSPIASPATTATAGRVSSFSSPRRFHLTKFTSTLSPQGPTGIEKRKKGGKSDIAVFVERVSRLKESRSLLDLLVTTAHGHNDELISESKDCAPVSYQDIVPSQKRPNASATERQWRAEQWGQAKSVGASATPPDKTGASIDTDSSLWDYNSLQLAEQLQEVARQESSKQHSSQVSPKNVATTKLKTRPKKPALRYAERHPEESYASRTADPMDLSSDTGDDSDYVYDTYIRQPCEPLIAGKDAYMENAESEDVLQGNFGLLVITDQDQEEWEAFADNDDSDKDWNSEEEDENAEDYYGNDYPEDEVESDDEFGYGAYNYRRGGSDDEEYDNEGDAWSDDGYDLQHPWKRCLVKSDSRSAEITNSVDHNMS